MALIVETGDGLADAESYISVTYFKSYCDAMGYSYAGKTDTEIEQALRRATMWIDAAYGSRFEGGRIELDQALVLPQSGLYDQRGYAIAADVVPVQVQKATAEAAKRELAEPFSLSPDVVIGQIEKRIKVEGIEIEYAPSSGVSGQLPTLSVVDGIMSSLFGVRNVYSGRLVRA